MSVAGLEEPKKDFFTEDYLPSAVGGPAVGSGRFFGVFPDESESEVTNRFNKP